MKWNHLTIRYLRLRYGWTKSDLARYLHCELSWISAWEDGDQKPNNHFVSELDILEKHAEENSNDIHDIPLIEKQLECDCLDQVEIDAIKDKIDLF